MVSRDRPLSIAILALGGQGGGVLTGWLVDTARANGHLAQSTYVAGVAQRTGATLYCVEMFPTERAEALGKEPIFTPYPVPGDVDLVIASEMAETGRAILKGFVTPNTTTLIASSHRVYSIEEKSAPDDGIADQSKVAQIAGRVARRFICFDMQATAEEAGSAISAVILGAVAASGALPFARDAFEQAIRDGGRAVEANLRGFAAGFAGAAARSETRAAHQLEMATPDGPNGQALVRRVTTQLPTPVQSIAAEGALRCLDYQDVTYANQYIDTLVRASACDETERGYALTSEIARQLALQMCYEDIVRVADLKTRSKRFERVREQVAATPAQPVRVVEYFHPRIEEVCDLMPAKLGAWVEQSKPMRKVLAPIFRKGRNLTTTSVSGFLLLRFLARLRPLRRGSYRFLKQQAFIHDWLGRVTGLATERYNAALAAARAIESVRGYGDTYQRGLARYQQEQGS